jgi:hypothetical protein
MPLIRVECFKEHADVDQRPKTETAIHGEDHADRRAVTAAWQVDCYKVMLMTGSKRTSTLAFYTSAGFEQNKTGFQIRCLAPRAEVPD